MKKFNVSLTKEKFSNMKNQTRVLSFLKTLGYNLKLSDYLPPEYWPATRSIYHSNEENNFQSWFFEMDRITESGIYPIIADVVRNKPWNLLLFTDNYDYLFFVLASASTAQNNSSVPLSDKIYPSVLIHRVSRKNPTSTDLSFMQELTKTQDQNIDQFEKLRIAFLKTTWISGDFDHATDPDVFHSLRMLLRENRHITYSNSWHQKIKHIIAPVIEILGYTHTPGRVTKKDLKIEPDLFLYRGESDKPGNVPVAACIFADPYQNPSSVSENSGFINHPDVHVSRLFLSNIYERIIVTDGRIWRIYFDTDDGISYLDTDLSDALGIEFSRVNKADSKFLKFYAAMTTEEKTDCIQLTDCDVRPLRKAVTNMIVSASCNTSDIKKTTDECIFQMIFALYGELTGKIKPIDLKRWNIPEFNRICQLKDTLDDDYLKACFLAHIDALNDLDRSRDIASCFFHNPHKDIFDTTSMNWIENTRPSDIRNVIVSISNYFDLYCSGINNLGLLSVNEFSVLVTKLLEKNSSEIAPDTEEKLSKLIGHRFEEITRKAHELNSSDAPRGDHLKRYLSESLFRFHAVDSKTGTGTRLLKLLHILEKLYLNAMDFQPDSPLHPRLPDLRNLLIRDSHEHQLFLDHSSLSDSKLMRLQIIQHCLYGILAPDELRLTPAILNLETDLNGIRFPYISHHYHPASDSALNRLSYNYSGNIPEVIQSIPSKIAGMVAASRWFAEQELDLDAFGPNFTFTRAQFRMIMKRVVDFQEEHPDDQGIPLELVFPWIFHKRLTEQVSVAQPGSGFDFVIE